MRVRRLDHVLLAMPAGRETDARNFYSGVLGIPEARKPAELAGRGGCWFEDGELKLHLGVEKNFTPARKAHPAFLVDDLDGTAVRLEVLGFAVDRTEEHTFPGHRRFHTADGNGNRVELLASL